MSDVAMDTQLAINNGENTMNNQFLTFYLDQQEFAIAIKYVVDIINIQPITPIPNVPDYVKGITNLRGKVAPIIDVRIRFGKMQKDYDDRTCIIVVKIGDMQVGLVIDQVSAVITLDDAQISPPPAFNQTPEARFVQGIGKAETGVKMILNAKMVLDDDMLYSTEIVE